MEQMLREENYQLKNEITDLKNAFDLNRDILKILSSYNARTDPQHHLLLQIITRLTTVNNQSMLNSIELIQEKNILKQENLRLNLEVKAVEERLAAQIENNRLCNLPNESKLLMQDQFNNLNKQLLAANEERITKDQEIQYWKTKYTQAVNAEEPPLQQNHSNFENTNKNGKIKRKYESNSSFKLQILLNELKSENRKLKRYIEQLENRLFVLIKAFQVKQESLMRQHTNCDQSFQSERQEIRLLKYALNSISIQKSGENEYVMSVTQRFREKDQMNNIYVKNHRSASWPKNHILRGAEDSQEQDIEIKFRREVQERMEDRQY